MFRKSQPDIVCPAHAPLHKIRRQQGYEQEDGRAMCHLCGSEGGGSVRVAPEVVSGVQGGGGEDVGACGV